MSKEAMKLALEALEYIDLTDNDRDFLHPHECYMIDEAITALREALAEQPAQQDDAWKAEQKTLADEAVKCATEALANPNHPATMAAREYYGAAQQEPVAWLVCENWRKHSLFFTEEGAEDFKNAAQREDDLSGNLARWKAKPLYTSPPAQRKPLTDEEQIAEALRRHSLTLVKTAKGYDVMSLGHITAHGITKGTK